MLLFKLITINANSFGSIVQIQVIEQNELVD